MTIEDIIRSTPEFKQSRLSSLYSNFYSHKELNPEGYEANVHAWHILLINLMKQNQSDSSISVSSQNNSLATSLSISPYGAPKNLGIVVDELISKGVFVPYSEYMTVTTSYSEKWSLFSIKNWVYWGLDSIGIIRKFSAISQTGGLKDDRYIAWDVLVQLANELLSVIPNNTGDYSDKLYSNVTLFNFLNTKHKINKLDFEIILKYWSRDKSVCQIKVDNITYIKFDQSDITEDDMGIIDIKTTLFHLSNRNKEITSRIEQLTSQAKQYLNNKQQVRHLLTQKQILNKSLNNTVNSFNELTAILVKINDSQMNHEIYTQLLTSSKVLQDLNSKVSMDDVETVKLDIEQEMSKVDEIGNALFNSNEQVEIEEELEELIKEDEAERRKEQELIKKLSQLKVSGPTETQPEKEEEQKKNEEQEKENEQNKEKEQKKVLVPN